MVNCFAVGCNAGYDWKKPECIYTEDTNEKIHFLAVPNDPKSESLWQKIMLRDDVSVKGKFVCSKHFHKEDILHERILKAPDGTIVGRSKYKTPRLRKGALPAFHLGRKEEPFKEPRKLPTKRELDEPSDNVPNKNIKLNEDEYQSSENIHQIQEDFSNPPEDSSMNNFFQDIYNEKHKIQIPLSWTKNNVSLNKCRGVTFCKRIARLLPNGKIDSFCQKEITIGEKQNIVIKINNSFVDHKEFGLESDEVHSIQELEDIIATIDKRQICEGSPKESHNSENNEYLWNTFCHKDKLDVLRHNKCPLLLPENVLLKEDSKQIYQCKFCKNIKTLIYQKQIRRQRNKNSKYLDVKNLSPRKQQKVKKIVQKLRTVNRAKNKYQATVRLLKQTIKTHQSKIIEISQQSIDKLLTANDKISSNEKLAIQEIVNASKVQNSKNRKYSDEWTVLCMLLHMRSPVTYRMLRDNEILPLPCVRTIRRYLSIMDCPCGFDPAFFEILKAHFSGKSELELNGILLVDEMKTRKSLLLDQKTMTYKGVEDFGDHQPKNVETELANNGLVFMFHPLYDNYSQPIAVFASKGPTCGDTLAKLLVQAIALLESAGAKIHGIVADGGSPNRKAWTLMGCSGKMGVSFKNWFENPVDPERKVFFFSDAPHLMKTIRNRLLNLRKLRVNPNEPMVEWDHYIILYELDSSSHSGPRLCPKITKRHVHIAKTDSLTQMRVSLAVQVFSASVANGLRYYKAYEERLKTCESTAKFSQTLNDMFDALNRTLKETALKRDCKDIKVLEDSLKWLNEWEQAVNDNLIKKTEFLTDQTAEGLRMTLQSTLDLVDYLLNVKKVDMVFTGRINQDSLERFFGTVRLAGGTNDHPGTPTFLQIYKILSFYSILKPPQAGNCSLPNTSTKPLMSMTQLKEMFKNNNKRTRQDFIKEIKGKLNIVIEKEDCDFSDFINTSEHDYDLPYVLDCLMYFVAANIAKKFWKFHNCELCRSEFIFLNENNNFAITNNPISQLIECQEESEITHPNIRLFKFLSAIEESFVKHSSQSNVYHLVINEISEREFEFPCEKHAQDILAYTLHLYVELRMRQFAHIQLTNTKQMSAQSKKIAKLHST